jgi:death-on-curing protein
MNAVFLTLDEILEIHRDQIRRYGGKDGVRDAGLLESAVAMPRAGSASGYLHRDVFEMAAAYLFHIVRNHPFIDGNKRTGAVAALVFLSLNGLEVEAIESALEEMVRGVAAGVNDKPMVAEFFRRRCKGGR